MLFSIRLLLPYSNQRKTTDQKQQHTKKMNDPTIFDFVKTLKDHIQNEGDVDPITKEEEFIKLKKSIQDGRLKSASSPSYFIMTINMNSPESRVTEKRRKFLAILMRSFFSSIIFCQELPGKFEKEVVEKCGTSGYSFVKNEKESAILWLQEDFHGETKGLETTSGWIQNLRDTLGRDASELLSRITMVKLTSKKSSEIFFLAVSWHGRHTATEDRKRQEFKCLLNFLDHVIKEKKIPSFIIGGDFNYDTLQVELPNDVVVSDYELSPRQTKREERNKKYIPHKDNFIWFPTKILIVSCVRPFYFEDKGTATIDFAQDEQDKVGKAMAEETNTPTNPTALLDHDPIIGVLRFPASSNAAKNLSTDFEKVAIADSKQP